MLGGPVLGGIWSGYGAVAVSVTPGTSITSTFAVRFLASGIYIRTHDDLRRTVHNWSTGSIQYVDENGSDAGKSNRIWSQKAMTLLSGGQLLVDLFRFTTMDLGKSAGRDALAMYPEVDELTLLLIRNLKTSVGMLVLGNSGGDEWTAMINAGKTLTLPPGGEFGIYTRFSPGYAVGVNNRTLKLLASGGNVNLDFHAAGRNL